MIFTRTSRSGPLVARFSEIRPAPCKLKIEGQLNLIRLQSSIFHSLTQLRDDYPGLACFGSERGQVDKGLKRIHGRFQLR